MRIVIRWLHYLDMLTPGDRHQAYACDYRVGKTEDQVASDKTKHGERAAQHRPLLGH